MSLASLPSPCSPYHVSSSNYSGSISRLDASSLWRRCKASSQLTSHHLKNPLQPSVHLRGSLSDPLLPFGYDQCGCSTITRTGDCSSGGATRVGSPCFHMREVLSSGPLSPRGPRRAFGGGSCHLLLVLRWGGLPPSMCCSWWPRTRQGLCLRGARQKGRPSHSSAWHLLSSFSFL